MIKRIRRMAFCLLCSSLVTSCHDRDGMWTTNYGETLSVRIAVVLPLSDVQKEQYEEALEWASENISLATSASARQVSVVYEWYDENTEDMTALAASLCDRSDLNAVIGPYSSAKTQAFAAGIRSSLLPVFTMSSSESVIRENIPAADEGIFLWAMQEADISQCELLLTLALRNGAKRVSLLVKDSDPYGQTFLDWFGFQSSELGLENDLIEIYTADNLEECIRTCLQSDNTDALIAVPSTVDEAHLIIETEMSFREESPDCPLIYYSDIAMNHTAFDGEPASGSTAQGVSVIASPESGFEVAFKIHSGLDLLNIESQIYDAAMITAMAAFDMELRSEEGSDYYDANNLISRNRAMNRAILRVVDGREDTGGAMTWQKDDMSQTFKAIENASYPDISGASGELDFDEQIHTNVLHSAYCHWQYYNGNFLRINYMTSDGSRRTESTLGCWNWITTGGQSFDSDGKSTYPTYSPLESHKAVLIGASYAWSSYRHQADALHMYRILKDFGFTDEDIILIMEDNLAYHEQNPLPGNIHTSVGGDNLYGDDIETDYKLTTLNAELLADILTEELDSDTCTNVFLYWCGHGKQDNLYIGDNLLGADEFCNILQTMYSNGKYRKLLCMIEACYAGSMAQVCEGIPGLLLYTATTPYETSKADNYDTSLSVYLTNRFSRSLREAIMETPSQSLVSLYYELYNHTPASHVTVYNADYFGNLYTSDISEFLLP